MFATPRWRNALLKFQTDIVARHDDLVGVDVFNSGRRHNLAGSKVKLGSVPGTSDTPIGDDAFAEGSVIVGANVIDSIDHTIHVEQPDRSAADLNSECAAWRQFVGRSDPVNWHRLKTTFETTGLQRA